MTSGNVTHLEGGVGGIPRVPLILLNHFRLLVVLILFVELVGQLLRSLVVVINLLVQLLVLRLSSVLLVWLQSLRRVVVRLTEVLHHILILIESFTLLAIVSFSRHVVLLRGLAPSSISASLTEGVIVAIGGPVDSVAEGLSTTTKDGEGPKPLV